MAVPAKEIDQRLNRFIEACRRSGHRVTHQRLEVVREAASTDEHPDIETIYSRVQKRVPTVSLDTVYRTMRLLVDLGLASAVPTDQERMRYDANTDPHHHFVCVRCGLVRDFQADARGGFRVPKEVESWGHVTSAHLELRGVCRRCRPRLREKD